MQHICAKLSYGLWVLLKLTDYVDINMLKTDYYTVIYSHFQYCITTWGVASTTALEPLKKMHKRVITIITNSSFGSHTTPIFKELNLLKISDVFKLKIAEKCVNIRITPKYTPLKAYWTSKKLTNITLGIHLIKITFLYKKEQKWAKSPFHLLDLIFGKKYY